MPERDRPRGRGRRRWPVLAASAVAGAVSALPGCVAIEAVAGAFGGGEAAEAPVEMRYAGLERRRIAVVAAVDPALARAQPDLGPALEALLADRFARHVPGAGVVPPGAVAGWRVRHPYWETVPPGRVTAGLGVERLVRVEVAGFRTHEEGNASVLEGRLDTALLVYAAPAGDAGGGGARSDPDRPVFADRVLVRFPEDGTMGIPRLGDGGDPGPEGIATPGGPDETAVARALLASWIRRTGPLFYDQKESRKRDERLAEERR